ncbi:MAG TPA: DinB family protein [Candidatus Acidoferrum sp.]|nr:DinB family protein [Candidatus Acidoferrum sp.]
MKKLLCSVLLFELAAIPAFAQGGGGGAQTPPVSASAPQQRAPVVDPLSTYIKGAFKSNSNYLIHSAEDMPEENYSMKLGTTPEVRTFAGMIGHVINANYVYCSRAKGEANPQTVNYETTAMPKADLVKAMHAAMDYCGPLYDALTDASAMEMVTPVAVPGRGPGQPYPRIQPLISNVIHNNEEYGNLVGYFRTKNLVPPSTALASQGGRGRGN